MMQIDRKRLVKGTSIQYVLPLSALPVNPEKLWHGKIIAAYTHGSYEIGVVQVECKDPGYEGCTELVHLYQIRAIEQVNM